MESCFLMVGNVHGFRFAREYTQNLMMAGAATDEVSVRHSGTICVHTSSSKGGNQDESKMPVFI